MAFEIYARILGDATGFDATMRQVQHAASETAQHVGGEFANKLTGLFSVGAIEEGLRTTLEYGEKIKNLNLRTGVGVEEIQKLDYAATLTGTSLEALVKGLELFGVAQAKARAEGEGGKHFEALKRMGLTKEQIDNTAEFVENFHRVGDHIKGAAVDGQLLADMTLSMGRSARELLPAFKEGLSDLASEAEKAGLVIPTDDIIRMAEASEKIKTIWFQIRTLFAEFVTVPLAEKFEQAAGWAEKFFLAGELVKEGAKSGKSEAEVQRMIQVGLIEVDIDKRNEEKKREEKRKTAKAGTLQTPAETEEEKAFQAAALHRREEGEKKLNAVQVSEAAKILAIRERIAENKRKDSLEGLTDQEKEKKIAEDIANMKKELGLAKDIYGETDLEIAKREEKLAQRESELKKLTSKPDQDKYITDSLARIGGYSSSAMSKMESLAERTAIATETIAQNTKAELFTDQDYSGLS